MDQQRTTACICGCDEHELFESQRVCTDCGRAVSDFELRTLEFNPSCPGAAEGNGSFVPATADGSHLCAPTRQRAPSRMPALKASIEFLAHRVGLPQPVLDQATAKARMLCTRNFQQSSESSRACVALFVACREEDYPTTLRSLCQWMSVGIPEAHACLRVYTDHAERPFPLVKVQLSFPLVSTTWRASIFLF